MSRTTVRVLGIVDQPYRGVVERSYADCLYLARVLNAQLGDLDLLLRGEAVFIATRTALEGEQVDGEAGTSLAAGLRDLLTDGVDVRADADDLQRLGVPVDALVDGVRAAPAEETTQRWPHYDAVWFL